jgi:hypothetical protein
VIDAKNGGFTNWRLEYGDGNDPSDWIVLAEGNNSIGQRDLHLGLEGCHLQPGHAPALSHEWRGLPRRKTHYSQYQFAHAYPHRDASGNGSSADPIPN